MAWGREPTPESAFRFERKFGCRLSYAEALRAIHLTRAGFRELYQERQINNVYFDDPSLANYFANADGARDRIKTRVRWYGDLSGEIAKPALELKVKRGWVGEKPTFHLAPFRMDGHFGGMTARDLFRRSDLPAPVLERVLAESPVLINRYTRRYFLSQDGQCRLTIDRDLTFYPCPFPGAFIPRGCFPPDLLIVELKYANFAGAEVDLIMNDLGLRLSKFSKYALGMETLYG